MKRFLLFAIAIVCVSIGMRAADIPGGGSYTVSDGVVTFSGTTAGAINQNWNALNFSGATRIKFDNTCSINQADLEKFLGTQEATYYVDLFDITNGDNAAMSTSEIDPIIRGAVTNMETNGWVAKGIILPFNSTVGTSEVIKYGGASYKSCTFMEYAAYYRESEIGKNLVMHVWDHQYWNGWSRVAGNNYTTATTHLNATTHPEIANASTVLISTISDVKFDLTKFSAPLEIEITGDNMIVGQTPPNTNIPDKADIYVRSTSVDKFSSHIESAGTKNTPTNLLHMSGTFSAADIAAVNQFAASPYHGPRVLDLSQVTSTVTKDMIESLANSDVEYLILPPNMTKDVVCEANYSGLPNLKAAISSSNTTLVAHVVEPGSLADARILATGGSTTNGVTSPNVVGLTSVTLTGSLNAADICANKQKNLDADGHWTTGTNALNLFGLGGEQTTIKTLDLEDAVFVPNSDMNFSYAGLTFLLNVKLPTDPSMTTIPAYCFQGVHLPELNNPPTNPADITTVFHELCIPYNYQYIEDGAFDGTMLNHITTTDANGALIDNGPLTYTLSANIKRLGTKPSNIKAKVAKQVFPHETGVLEIYSLATKTPECYKGVFPANAMYGYGGFDENMAFCRDKYYNGSSLYKSFAVLRFPSEDSYNAVTDPTKKDVSYLQMKKNYTDINKVFTKKEQTGAVDANGDPVTWPSLEEVYRAFNQASLGLTWTDWKYGEGAYDGNNEICGGQPAATPDENGIYQKTSPGEGDHVGSYPFDQYAGWHQIILSQATYVDPAETVVNEKIIREYENAGWYTLCIPYSLTEDQVINWLGVPKSTDKIINKLDGEDVGNTYYMPDVRTLRSVTRKPGKTNEVTFLLTNNLVNINSGTYQYWSINDANPNLSDYAGCGMTGDGKKIVIRGGYPYIIKVYKRKGETIKNLGKYLMKRYADVFEDEVSCVYIDKCHENLNGDSETAKFAKPFEHHKIQAYLDEDSSNKGYTTHADNTKYYYTLIGQFWDQPLPQYSFYMVNKDTDKENMYWYRYSSGTKNYTWEQYKCIIMATQEKDDTAQHPNSGKYRDNENSIYPEVTGYDSKHAEIFKKTLEIKFLKGRDDSVFEGENLAKYNFVFDDDIVEIDEEDNDATSIKQLDGEVIPTATDRVKVYNMAGQYVGNSTNGLSKGMYIVNGKKVVVQ